MDTRRDFLKKAALLGTTLGMGVLPESIQRAFAIDPKKGSTFLDAEHVVILMQENRSFDHCYGTLQGVRGYNDPRAFVQPNQNPVWLQTNKAGETYAPFRLDIKGTNATWMGSLPHTWANQVDARNHGRYDQWLTVKKSGRRGYAKMPLTMGHYTRDDIPFYYAFADAFTVCDQHFCSSLTGTTPNRLYLWTGTLREKQEPSSPARVYNEETTSQNEARWTTFPERLEKQGISWKIYQNELDITSGLKREEVAWLSNFGCNSIESFTQFNVRFAPSHRNYLARQVQTLSAQVDSLKQQVQVLTAAASPNKAYALRTCQQQLQQQSDRLSRAVAERDRWSAENFEKLSHYEKRLHKRAFSTNRHDPNYRSLEALTYSDQGTNRTVQVPKGDVLHQFRQDVMSGQLPAVSWLVGPEHFSGHPASPWYGAWYLSEALDILTQNPEVWKKTIFILTYDENDGYFDHVLPFVAPAPNRPETGLASKSIDTSVDYIDLAQDLAARPNRKPRDSPLGLGYRVPMVIASPWSRGGCVCSEVFDHTSVLQFLETFLTHKTGKKIEESNISSWRRTVCGDLTSAFHPYYGEKIDVSAFVPRDAFIESIHKAQRLGVPTNYKSLTAAEIEQVRKAPKLSPLLPRQERGIRRSCALPYQLYADGVVSPYGKHFNFHLEARRDVFGANASGSPFNVTAYTGVDKIEARAYAVAAGDTLSDGWPLDAFAGGRYRVRIDGPNGFFREFQGAANGQPPIGIHVGYGRLRKSLNGNVEIHLRNHANKETYVVVRDNAYGGAGHRQTVKAGGKASIVIDTRHSHGWYDFSIQVGGRTASASNNGGGTVDYRYAGRVETGAWSYSDPAMGWVA